MIRIHLIHTRYPQWGAYSGMNQYLRYLNPERFDVHAHTAQDNDEDFPFRSPKLRGWVRRRIQRRGMSYYKLSDLTAEAAAIRRCWLGKVDVVHYLDGEHSAQYLPLLFKRWRLGRAKVLATYHQPRSLLEKLVDREVIRRLDGVTVVSPEQVPFFSALFPAERIRVIPLGIDTDFFRPAPESVDRRPVRCITVGHWLRDYATLRGVAETLAGDRGVTFQVVVSNRSGPRETGLEGLPNVALFRENVDDAALLRLYQQAHILLLPLIQCTANNALVEGIACGLPVIATALPSVRAYLSGKGGILLPQNEPRRFAEAVLDLAGHPQRRRSLAREARLRAEELDWRRIAPQFEALYAEMAHEH